MAKISKITPCLWFDNQAEQAVKLYVSLFKKSSIDKISRYGKEGFEIHGRPAGSVMAVNFTLEGQSFMALNGGPMFKLSEAVSFMVSCETQAEIDHFWGKLSKGGDPKAQQCGWLKDRFGLSWQIVPSGMSKWMSDPDPRKSARVMHAFMPMKKLSIAKLLRAYDGA